MLITLIERLRWLPRTVHSSPIGYITYLQQCETMAGIRDSKVYTFHSCFKLPYFTTQRRNQTHSVRYHIFHDVLFTGMWTILQSSVQSLYIWWIKSLWCPTCYVVPWCSCSRALTTANVYNLADIPWTAYNFLSSEFWILLLATE